MQIFISGSLAYDRIMDFPGKFSDHILPDKIHILNVCFMVNGLTEKHGGTAGNIAFSLSLLGEKPLILAAAGKDFDQYEAWLASHDLPLDGIRKIPEAFTSSAYITTDMMDNQITGFNPGAMKYPSQHQISKPNPGGEALAIVAPGNLDDMLIYSRRYKELMIPYIFDPGQSIPALSPDALSEMISGSQLLISNDYELEMIKKATGMKNSDLLESCRAIITTLGENGSLVLNHKTKMKIPVTKPERIVDPTGAGDAYRAGVIKGMVMKKTLIESAKIGATCASYAIEHYGTQEHHFSQEDFWTRHRDNFGE
jgi:adenosine kinase